MAQETSSSLKTTPLIDIHKEYRGKLVPFAGWKMPIQFQGVIKEHQCVRDGVGIFDVSHMGEIEIQGPSAKSLIQKLITNDIDSIQDNQALYTLMCLENGGVVDDLLVHRFSEDDYFLCVNAANTEKDFQWIKKASAVANLPDLVLQSDGDVIKLVVTEKQNDTSDDQELIIGDGDGKKYFMAFKAENIKILSGDYTVFIAEQKISKFVHKTKNIVYHIALEPDSTYEG